MKTKSLDEIKTVPGLLVCEIGEDGGAGMLVKRNAKMNLQRWASVIWSFGGGWEHVSISPFNHSHTPTWDEMCKVKDMFFSR